MLTLAIHPRRICMILFGFAFFFLVQSVVFRYVVHLYEGETPFVLSRLARLFYSSIEASIPTYFSIFLLTVASVLLALIAYSKYTNEDRFRFLWSLLAIIFLYLAIDESAEIHEMFTNPLRDAFDLSGFLFFSWVIVGVIFVAIVGIIYIRFLLYLPRRMAKLMILSAVIYVSGAIILESISANIWDMNDEPTLIFWIVGSIEEFFEMSGVILFIYTLLIYLEETVSHFQIRFTSDECDGRFA